MGAADIAERTFLELADVAADVINVQMYGGIQVITAADLILLNGQGHTEDEAGRLHDRRRDVYYKCRRDNTTYALIGIENAAAIDNTMPLRVMGYDYAPYMRQAEELQRENRKQGRPAYVQKLHPGQKLTPVVTIVLYYGKHWDGPMSLWEMLDFDGREHLKPFVPDIRINLLELGDRRITRMFCSDMGIISEYLSLKGDRKGMLQFGQKHHAIRHPIEMMDVMAVLGRDNTYKKIKQQLIEEDKRNKHQATGREETDMCELVDVFKELGVEQGIEALILDNLEEGKTRDIIVGKVMRRFHVDKKEAEAYFERFAAQTAAGGLP